jgi:ferritin-like metal-binding protein YciE
MAVKKLHDLFIEQLSDVYDAEQQLTKALPKMAEAASSQDLQQAFELHLQQTRQQAQRIERIFDALGEKPKNKTCKGMKGLIEEGEEIMKEDGSSEAKDAGLIAAAQKVEHYEIATYGTLRTYAREMGHTQAADMLQQTLDEESQTNEKLTQLATQHINIEALR